MEILKESRTNQAHRTQRRVHSPHNGTHGQATERKLIYTFAWLVEKYKR